MLKWYKIVDTPSNYFALATCYFYNYLGIGKKINALAKQKECEAAGLWKISIVNHLYWVAGSGPEGNQDMLEQMLKSVSNHIQDIHVGHGDLFPECTHGVLDEAACNKEWLEPG